jgi:hypothetical protein
MLPAFMNIMNMAIRVGNSIDGGGGRGRNIKEKFSNSSQPHAFPGIGLSSSKSPENPRFVLESINF